MVDLNSTLFFKGKFEIRTKNNDKDLLWDLILKVRGWMVAKWRKNGEEIPYRTSFWTSWKFGTNFSSKTGIVHFRSVYHRSLEENEFWACKIIESWPSKNGYAPREWVTEIGFRQTSLDSAAINIVIYYSDRPGFIGPCEPDPDGSIPNIIRKYVGDPAIECTAEGYPFDLKAIHLVPGDFLDFWRVICDEMREIPIIYISPRRIDAHPNAGENLIDAQKLVELLGPNALVYYADDIDFSREMSELCRAENFGCYSGGIRIYAPHPHINDKADPYRHRYISARDLSKIGASVYSILRRAFAQDVHFYDKMFRMEDCKALNDKAAAEKRKQEYKESLEADLLISVVAQELSLSAQLEKIDDERYHWELDRETYENEIRDLKSDLHLAKTHEDAYRRAAALSTQRKDALDAVRTIAQYPKSAQEIARYFCIHFADRIVFTERGNASLRECNTDPSILWDALYQMATTLYDLLEDPDITLVDHEFNRRSKLRLARSEGTMTRKDATLMRQYLDTYQGKSINIEAHIKTNEAKETSPRFLRIYFNYDGDSHKIIIGSCGKHLENFTTAKIK